MSRPQRKEREDVRTLERAPAGSRVPRGACPRSRRCTQWIELVPVPMTHTEWPLFVEHLDQTFTLALNSRKMLVVVRKLERRGDRGKEKTVVESAEGTNE